MYFTSPVILAGLLLLILAYNFIPKKGRPVVLLAASIFFYAHISTYFLIVAIILTAISYYVALQIPKHEGIGRKILLAEGIILCLLPLFFLKYLKPDLQYIAKLVGWNYSTSLLQFLLPVGLSFYTLELIAYLIDVNNKKQEPEKNIIIHALSIIFFAKIISGPINKLGQLARQFRDSQKPTISSDIFQVIAYPD